MDLTHIKSAVAKILAEKKNENRYKSRGNRFRSGNLGLPSMLALLEEDGWTVEITITKNN